MKKIVSIVVLMIAFGFSANAQSNVKLESNSNPKDQNVVPCDQSVHHNLHPPPPFSGMK